MVSILQPSRTFAVENSTHRMHMETLTERPNCAISRSLLEVCGAFLSDIYTLLPYDNSDQLWSLCETNSVQLMITKRSDLGARPRGLLKGIHVLHPEMVHLFLFNGTDCDELIEIVNLSNRIRVVKEKQLEAGVRYAAADAFSLFLLATRKDRQIEELSLENEQYEFMLRQSLLS